MTYYLLLEGDSEKDVYFDSNVLGEESFGTFYAGQGLVALNNIVNQRPELLETIKILDDYKKSYTLTEFFDLLSKLKVMTYCRRSTMNNWREYEEIEEEFHKETAHKVTSKIKKKKTWKQINEEKQRQVTKKQWQKKRRKSKKEGDK